MRECKAQAAATKTKTTTSQTALIRGEQKCTTSISVTIVCELLPFVVWPLICHHFGAAELQAVRGERKRAQADISS